MDGSSVHGSRCPDIEVAASVSFSGDRSAALVRIAERQDLSEHEQMFLVDAAVDCGGFSSDVANTLVVLARNPTLTKATRQYISERQHDAGLMSSDTERLARALAESPSS